MIQEKAVEHWNTYVGLRGKNDDLAEQSLVKLKALHKIGFDVSAVNDAARDNVENALEGLKLSLEALRKMANIDAEAAELLEVDPQDVADSAAAVPEVEAGIEHLVAVLDSWAASRAEIVEAL